jgi:quinol monooxygenase YgiN
MPKVVLKGFILVPERDLLAVIGELKNHRRLTQQEPGCLEFRVTQNSEVSTRFDVYEEFVDKEAFEAHQLRIKTSTWAEISENVTRHYQIFES